MSKAETEKLIDKIKKLLNKGTDAQRLGNLAEAEVFLKKVEDLVMQNGIDIMELSKEDQGKIKVVHKVFDISDELVGGEWKALFLHVLSHFNMCKPFVNKHMTRFTVIGTEDMVDVVEYLYNNLVGKMFLWAKYSWLSVEPEDRKGKRQATYMKDYLMGAVGGFKYKLKEQQDQFMKLNEENTTGLIKLNLQIVTDALENGLAEELRLNMKGTQKIKNNTKDVGTYYKGFEKGYAAQTDKAIAHTPEKRKERLLE